MPHHCITWRHLIAFLHGWRRCKGAGDVHLSNSTQQWAEERAGQQAGNQDDCWGFGRPSEGELSVVGGAEHYIRVGAVHSWRCSGLVIACHII